MPRTNRRRLARWWPALAWAALLLYGSLLPFDIDLRALTSAERLGLSRIGFRDTTLEDILVNLFVYVPLGLSIAGVFAARRPRRLPSWISMAIAVALSAAFSVAVETLQTASSSRVASWTDAALNTLGAGIGVLLAAFLGARARSIIPRIARSFADRPFNASASVLIIALLVYNLAPFDFVTTTSDLHASFGRARIVPIRLPDPFAAAPLTTHQIGEMQGAAWFLILGYLLALAGREIRRHPAAALASALKHGVGLAGLIECMQLFTQSHTFDAFTIVLRTVGVAFGAWCAVFLVDAASHSGWRRRPALAAPAPLLALAALFQVALLFLPALGVRGLSWHDLHWSALSVGGLHGLPFESLWRAPATVAAMDVASKLVVYGSLVVTLAVFLRRLRVDRAVLMAGAAVVMLAGLSECWRSAAGTHAPDATVVLLAGISGVLVRGLDRSVGRLRSWTTAAMPLAPPGR